MDKLVWTPGYIRTELVWIPGCEHTKLVCILGHLVWQMFDQVEPATPVQTKWESLTRGAPDVEGPGITQVELGEARVGEDCLQRRGVKVRGRGVQ